MNVHSPSRSEVEGQATFGMANLRMERTGLPFIVFISQKDDARHDVRVKVSPVPRVRLDAMSAYALRPFGLVGGPPAREEPLLRAWANKNLAVLVGYWDGTIEYTEDAVAALQPL